jgi:hypothetical protein
MKELILLSKSVKVETDKLSKGLCAMHEEDEEKRAVLAFGMLDAKLCEIFSENLSKSIKAQFSEVTNMIYEDEIKAFVKEVNNEVTKGVYRYIKIIYFNI